MGMDVYGESGNYFRASVWSWRPIVAAMADAGFKVPEDWHFNDGAGLRSQEECDELADLMETYLKEHQDREFEMEPPQEALDIFGRNPYSVGRDHLEEWIRFLRECGGKFQIC